MPLYEAAKKIVDAGAIYLTPQLGVFSVQGSLESRQVSLYPPKCSCNQRNCQHILACQIAVGMPNELSKKKKNCTQYRKRARNKKENRKIGSKRARIYSDNDEDLPPWTTDQLAEEKEEEEMMLGGYFPDQQNSKNVVGSETETASENAEREEQAKNEDYAASEKSSLMSGSEEEGESDASESLKNDGKGKTNLQKSGHALPPERDNEMEDNTYRARKSAKHLYFYTDRLSNSGAASYNPYNEWSRTYETPFYNGRPDFGASFEDNARQNYRGGGSRFAPRGL